MVLIVSLGSNISLTTPYNASIELLTGIKTELILSFVAKLCRFLRCSTFNEVKSRTIHVKLS